LVSAGLLALLFWLMRDEFRDIWTTISTSSPVFIFLAIGLFLVTVLMLSLRLKIVFKGENLYISMNEAVQLTYIGYFFNNFMPTAVGGDIVKAHYAANNNKKRLQSYASVLMDRFIGLYTFLIVAAIALVFDRGRFELKVIRPMVFMFLAVGVMGFFIVTNKTIARILGSFFRKVKMLGLGQRLSDLYDIVHDYRNRRDVVVRSILVSMTAQSIYFMVVYLFFISLGKQVGIGNVFLIMPIVTFISMMPSVGGLGVREGALVAFFTPLAGKEAAFAASILLLFALLFISLIGGIIYLWWGFTGVRKKEENLEE